MNTDTTSRGFFIVKFIDSRGQACSIQESSAMDDSHRGMNVPGSSFLWIGTGDCQMHVARDQVRELIPILQRWIDNGSIAEVDQ